MDYSKIPDSLHVVIIEKVNANDYEGLLIIHNEYKLTQYNYNCCNLDGLMEWFKYGIESGQIKNN